MTDFVGEAVGERIAGGRPSRIRAIGAAIVIAAGAAMLAYRLLRSESADAGVDAAGN
jgi:hypothetical protein